jgi:dihydrofolate reductase
MTASLRPTGHVFIAASLDGFIAREDGDIDWLTEFASTGEDTGYDAFMGSIDGLVMGRGTFEKALTFEVWPFKKPVIVLSRTLSQAHLAEAVREKVRISAAPPAELLAMLGREGCRRVYVDGDKVIHSFLQEDLIEDFVVTRVPVILGGGLPLFGSSGREIKLDHIETTSFRSGLVQSRYRVRGK